MNASKVIAEHIKRCAQQCADIIGAATHYS